ncbi:discoidin domain-containing protein [Streptacidiphilus sp. N1-3]|uniref:Probable beta-glucosidase G n=1 Tax=Streptacidiphilus alkalitolerans TaxID=3342712 RepID=A0ABV6X240_9ACTN
MPPGTSRPWRALAVLVGVLLLAALVVVPRGAAAAAPVLLSQGKPATASSTENAGTPASAAVDGNTGTRWSSAFSDPQWLEVDLGSSQSISQVVLTWETAAGKAYQIQTSTDGTTWTPIYSTTTGAGGTETLNVTGTGRYVRMYGTARTTGYGYSLWEFQVYGGGTVPTTCGNADIAQGHPATASSTEKDTTPAAAAVDGDGGTRWSSAFSDPQWLQVDLGSSQTVCGVQLAWEAAYAKAYQVQISTDGTNWTSLYSTTNGPGGTENLTVSGTGRYLRMYGTQRGTAYGYSLWTLAVFTPGNNTTPSSCPWVGSTAPVADRVAQLLGQMTQAQKVSMLHGGGSSPYVGNVSAIPSLCIPQLTLHDGPEGVGDGFNGVTQLPAPVAAAATWDTSLEKQYGAVAGNEFAGKGVNVGLGPTLNIDRDPRWGRAFETFSEDPYLTAQMATADIQGIQSQGVMAQAKHVAVYNQETNRNTPADNAVIDTRTLQEIYLPGFQAAVSKGATASVMCAYSSINGVYACQNPYLLNTALYQQAGFGGFVTSDWGATHATAASINAGMTMEMPGSDYFGAALTSALSAGTVTQATLNTMVGRVLTQMFAFGLFDKAPSGSSGATVTTAAHQATGTQVAQQGTVLLKNSGVLPLSTSTTHSIAVIGSDASTGVLSVGGGSAGVNSSGTVTPLTGIQNRAGSGVSVQYNDGSNATTAATLARSSDVAIVFASYGESEGSDIGSIDLPSSLNTLITQVAAANPKTIVVLNTGSAVTMPWVSQVSAVMENWYAGQGVGTALAQLIFGDADFSGKLPITFPQSLADVPAASAAQFPGTGGTVQYSEGLDVGYRWYDAKNKTPLFPFGFGLSYTSFGFSGLQVGTPDAAGNVTVKATVTNTGTREGAEIAQLYLGDPASTGEPARQLKGFQRVDLQPGASQQVSFALTAHDLAYWNTTSNGWTAASGAYQVSVGDSSRSLPLTGSFTLGSTISPALTASVSVSGAADPAAAKGVAVNNPHGMSSRAHTAARLPISATGNGVTFTATGLPAGLSISAAGVISGTATTPGTSTVAVTGTDSSGARDTASFVWTVVG